MRILVAVLALLAAVKIYTQDQMYKTAVTQALVSAYRERAITACQKERSNQNRNMARLLWSNPTAITISIGRADLDVGFWNRDSELWDAAYKRPYLVLFPTDPLSPLKCTFDITSGAANISQRPT